MARQLPQPQVQAFLTCREILDNTRTGEYVLIGPFTYVPAAEFPINLRASLYIQFKGGHGKYELDLQMRDLEGDVSWRCQLGELNHSDPLLPFKIAIHDAIIAVPKPGKVRSRLVRKRRRTVLSDSLDRPPDVFCRRVRQSGLARSLGSLGNLHASS